MPTTPVLLALILTACASPPPKPAAPSAAPAVPVAPTLAATATPATAATTTAAASGPSAETIKRARALGLKPRARNGGTMYCKDYADTGSHIESEHCYGSDVLKEVVLQMESLQDALLRRPLCGSAGCAGTN
ncbi:MAG TPA: hypothetical protein VMU00_11830 [Steroidobacteraceae bacterium]|nr:hypothetical protein [Steroidobacteraceae bacterium]